MKPEKDQSRLKPRDRLLLAAELFYEEGINAVGINRVLEEAKTPVASLYRNFGSKEGLVEEFLRKRDHEIREGFERGTVAQADNGRDRILVTLDIVADLISIQGYKGCPFTNASIEAKALAHPYRQIALQHKDWARGLVRRFAEEMGVVDPDALARQLCMLIDGAFVTAELRPEDPTVVTDMRAAAVALLDATAARKKRAAASAR